MRTTSFFDGPSSGITAAAAAAAAAAALERMQQLIN
jgi:hypothetical protein